MRDLRDVLDAAADHERGAELELRDPVDGTPTGIKITLAGPDSETARKARLAMVDRLAEMADHDGRVSAENRERARIEALAALVIRWDVREGGEPIPCTTANVIRLLKVQWVHEAVDAFAGTRANFRPEA